MKYKWTSSPPKGIPGVASVSANVWPKPDKKTLKYSWACKGTGNVLVAIGQLKTGRWEVYLLGWWIIGQPPNTRIKQKWYAQSRMCSTHRIGYSNYQNAYRSISQHLKGMR